MLLLWWGGGGVSEEREVTRNLAMTVEESSDETQVSNQFQEAGRTLKVSPYGWDGDLLETNGKEGVRETVEVDRPDMEEGDLL